MTPEILDNLPFIAGGLFLVGGVLAAALWRGGGGSNNGGNRGRGGSGGAPPRGAEAESHADGGRDDGRGGGVPGLAILGVVPAVDEGHPLLLHRLPTNAPLAEAYRQVWAQVGVTEKAAAAEGAEDVVPRVFAVAGLDGHSGASTTTANLATAAARLGYRVLVVDADLARPSQQELLCPYADPASPGLAEMLASGSLGDAADVAQQTLSEGVRLIPAGDVEAGQADIFGLVPSQPSQRFIRSVAPALAEIVLFDCPPILSGEPGMEAMCEVEDGVLVVVGADGFDKARLAQAVKWLEESGGELRGAILVPPIRDEVEAEAPPVAAAAAPRTSSEIIAAAIAESERESETGGATEVEETDFEDEEEGAEETMPDEQPEPVTARVGHGVEVEEEEEEDEVPARPLFLSESSAPSPADSARRRPAHATGGVRARETEAFAAAAPALAGGESAAPPTPVVTPILPTAFSAPAAVTPPTGGEGFVATAADRAAFGETPAAEARGDAGVADEEEDAEAGHEAALEEAGFATEEITANAEGAGEADEEDVAEGEEIAAPAAPRLSVSLDDIAFAESFAEAFANAPESTFDISEGETVTLVPTTDAQTLTPPPPPAFAPAANPVPAAAAPAPAPAPVAPVAAAVAPAAATTLPAPAALPRRTEMMMEMVTGAEDATTLRATTASPASAQTPRVTLEITTKRGESLGMRAGTPNAGEDGQLPPDVLLETTTREEAPDAATMRLLVSDAASGGGDDAGDGTVLEASLQKPEAMMIRSGAGQTGEVGVRFEVNSDQSGGTRFRATVARRDEPATYLVEMERTLVEEPLPDGTADVPKRQWRNRVSLRTVEKE